MFSLVVVRVEWKKKGKNTFDLTELFKLQA